MGETAGGCATVGQRIVADRYGDQRMRRLVREEIRRNELLEKNRQGGLSNAEKTELAGDQAKDVLNWFDNTGPGVCYTA